MVGDSKNFNTKGGLLYLKTYPLRSLKMSVDMFPRTLFLERTEKILSLFTLKIGRHSDQNLPLKLLDIVTRFFHTRVPIDGEMA